MGDGSGSSLANHRERMARRGLVRVEVNVNVSRDDASLVRQVAAALSDPARQESARRLLRQIFPPPPEMGLKALLAAAPLEGIELDRASDYGRDVVSLGAEALRPFRVAKDHS